MGDRAQIAIKQYEDSNIYLYTHWGGSEIYEDLRVALSMHRRWEDPEYLARIVFCQMLTHACAADTGFGIGVVLHSDNEYPVPVLDCRTQTISWLQDHRSTMRNCSFEEFIAGKFYGSRE